MVAYACGDMVESDDENGSDWELPLSLTESRHTECIEGAEPVSQTWRMKERMKTVSVALVLCLNVGVDPPDIVKTQPCARLECWTDPQSMSPAKALESIGGALQKQYERWQPRARYKQSLDPTGEEVKKLCTSLRRNAKEERVLFHYNGHGVPKPTANGEIWVFNRTYTQYIPLSVYDLQTWMGAPSIYVYDCSCAGIIVESFKTFAEQHRSEHEQSSKGGGGAGPPPPPPPPPYHDCIQLAACGPNQILPMNPELPADMFTACLTTPIRVALRWFVMQNARGLVPDVTLDLVDKIPGQLSDRRTMIGELNWIFTAITDTIAWNTLPRELFQKLFRQDLLVASLFRNFLLAERVLRSYDCTPVSQPALPATYQHPMWQAWDLALDLSLGQLAGVLVRGEEAFRHLPFFEEQLTAFQVWLTLGSEKRSPPEQLPIVLQVLLSQVHRLRALELLGRFLDLGPWAVNLALSVGIFPYVLKLLQSSARELRPLLVFIWAKILAVDGSCQADLVRDNGHKYFLSVLQDPSAESEHRTLSAFVLASIVRDHPAGQRAALQGSLVSVCLEQLGDPGWRLRQWLAICLGRLWDKYEKARWTGVRDIAHEKLYALLRDPRPETRAAAVYALGTFTNSVGERSEHANNIDHNIAMTLVQTVAGDASWLVRRELVAALQWAVLLFESGFSTAAGHAANTAAAAHHTESPGGLKRVSSSSSLLVMTCASLAYGSVYGKLWAALVALESDPHPAVAAAAYRVSGHVRSLLRPTTVGSSVSLPPSPNARSSFLSQRGGEPQQQQQQQQLRCQSAEPIVATAFVEWAAARLSASRSGHDDEPDVESAEHHERDWRYLRNAVLRREAREERLRLLPPSGGGSRVDLQAAFSARAPAGPVAALLFHPYEKQLAVACGDGFSLLDWGTGARLSSTPLASSPAARRARVTSLDWVNAHDLPLLLAAGGEDGAVRAWDCGGLREPRLVAAWQALPSSSPSSSRSVVIRWQQTPQLLHAAASDARFLRLWDAERELRLADLPTGCDGGVRSLDCGAAGSPLLAAGCTDGSTRLFDRRLPPPEARVRTWRDLPATVTAVRMRDGDAVIVAASSSGDVRVYDARSPSSTARSFRVVGADPTAAVVVHAEAEVVACAAAPQPLVSLCSFDGRHLGAVRFYEGFMGHRAGHASCLAFHPYRLALAAATVDNTLAVYAPDQRR